MRSALLRRPLVCLWITVAVQLAGRALDAAWHASHNEFEGAAEQLEAHWLAWIGVLATLAVSWVLARAPSTRTNLGYLLTASGASAYVPIALWHFIEHANGSDPEVAHILIAVTQVVMFLGVFVATFIVWRGRRGSRR